MSEPSIAQVEGDGPLQIPRYLMQFNGSGSSHNPADKENLLPPTP